MTFVIVAISTALFIAGTWLVVRALGEGHKQNSLAAAMFAVIGLGLKFPAVIIALKIAKSPNAAERSGAMIAVVLVYSLSVVAAAIYGHHQNKTDS